MDLFGSSGQDRRQWLDRQGNALAEGMRYYMGPSGVDQRVNALASAAPMMMGGQDYLDAQDGAGNMLSNPSLANALAFAGPMVALAMPGVGYRMAEGLADAGGTAARFMADEAGNLTLPGGSKAQRIAEMLATGRANEVTDDMLAELGPEGNAELFDLYRRGATGADMPMDVQSRMARAQEMGFPAYKYDGESYHLTANDVAEFRGGPTWARIDKSTNPAAHNVGRNFGVEGANDMPLLMRGDRAMPFDAREMPGGDNLPYSAPSEWSDAMNAAGKDFYELGNERISINPANIRSRFARFDPRLKHLASLSAGGAALAYMTPEQESAQIRAYLATLE